MYPDHFDKEDLIRCGHGELFPGAMRLPIDEMLMVDRITHIGADDGAYGKGSLVAELDINPDLWFFKVHFDGDPVMPGCLGLDALWQLTGFYLGWTGAPGRGRALGVGSVKFTEQVQPDAKLLQFRIDIRRIMSRQITLGIANGTMLIDGKTAYETEDMRVTLFSDPEG